MAGERLAEQLDRCSWPALTDPYDIALREAVEFTFQRFEVSGIFACGSVIRGEGDALSDIDLYVVNADPFRQRFQRRFNGIPTEIFVNPAHQIRAYFADEHAVGRPCTAHMLSTGHVVLSNDPVVEQLIGEARFVAGETSFIVRPDGDVSALPDGGSARQRRGSAADRRRECRTCSTSSSQRHARLLLSGRRSILATHQRSVARTGPL